MCNVAKFGLGGEKCPPCEIGLKGRKKKAVEDKKQCILVIINAHTLHEQISMIRPE